MNLSSQDRNTAFTLAIVLIVCTISLVVVASSLIQLLSPVFNQIGRILGSVSVQAQSVDYNFPIPTTSAAQATITASSSTSSAPSVPTINYNFPVGQQAVQSSQRKYLGKQSSLWKDLPVVAAAESAAFYLSVNRIGLDLSVWQSTNPAASLRRGGWLATPTAQLFQHPVTILCERTYFAPQDARSCWNLNLVKPGEEINLRLANVEYVYQVVGINSFDHTADFIYTDTQTPYLRLVTNNPAGNSDGRLVMLAAPLLVRYVD